MLFPIWVVYHLNRRKTRLFSNGRFKGIMQYVFKKKWSLVRLKEFSDTKRAGAIVRTTLSSGVVILQGWPQGHHMGFRLSLHHHSCLDVGENQPQQLHMRTRASAGSYCHFAFCHCPTQSDVM